jgi:hypothetical protein
VLLTTAHWIDREAGSKELLVYTQQFEMFQFRYIAMFKGFIINGFTCTPFMQINITSVKFTPPLSPAFFVFGI